MWRERRPMVEGVWSERALFGATVFAIVWLLGPGAMVVNAILGPATDLTGSLTWLEDAAVAPEDAFLRIMTALGLVLAFRLTAALLLALVSWIPGPTAAGAARLGRFLAPPLARHFIDVIVGISLTSGTGIALAAPALAAAHPAAAVVPSPVLAPPEATLQTWPDLGRPGTDAPTPPAPHATAQDWPDLGRPGTNVLRPPASSSAAPDPTSSPGQSSTHTSRSRPSDSRPARQPAAAGAATSSPADRPASTTSPPSQVVVAPGDCLWTLAQRDLEHRDQAAPSASDIASATERWWQANRAAIGADPDRLLPGQRLQPPV